MKRLAFILLILTIVSASACKKKAKNNADTTKPTTDLVVEDTPIDSSALGLKDTTDLIIVPDKDNVIPKYYLIVGSFQQFKNAQKLDSTLKKGGDQSALMDSYNSFTRVAKSVHDTRAEAEVAVKQYRAQHPDVEAWLLKK